MYGGIGLSLAEVCKRERVLRWRSVRLVEQEPGGSAREPISAGCRMYPPPGEPVPSEVAIGGLDLVLTTAYLA